MRVEFTKMHGVGNDFVVFDAPLPDSLLDPTRLRSLADRRTGIGFDQVLLLETAQQPGRLRPTASSTPMATKSSSVAMARAASPRSSPAADSPATVG